MFKQQLKAAFLLYCANINTRLPGTAELSANVSNALYIN